MTSRGARIGILFAVYSSMSAPAFAYLDGATGSIILQATIGAVATGLVYYRLFTARAKAFFGRILGKTKTEHDGE